MGIFHKLFWVLVVSLSIHSIADAHREVKFVQEFGGKGTQEGQFAEKTFFAFDRDGGIYVADTENYRIQKLDANGRFQFEIQPTESDAFILRNPTDITVGQDGAVYVMDWIIIQVAGTESPKVFNYAPCVHRFDSDGNLVGKVK